jgi:hypothetical protein
VFCEHYGHNPIFGRVLKMAARKGQNGHSWMSRKMSKKDPPDGMDSVPPHLITLIKLQILQYNLLAYIVMIFLFSNEIFSSIILSNNTFLFFKLWEFSNGIFFADKRDSAKVGIL